MYKLGLEHHIVYCLQQRPLKLRVLLLLLLPIPVFASYTKVDDKGVCVHRRNIQIKSHQCINKNQLVVQCR